MSQIKLHYKNKDYILEYNRTSAINMERFGFDISALDKKINTMIPLLVYGAFLKNHPKVKTEKAMEIYEAQNHKTELISALAEMYAQVTQSLFDDEEVEGEEKNATWEIL